MWVAMWTGTVIEIDATVVTRGDLVVRVLIDLLTGTTIATVTDIGVDVLDGVDENMLAAATTTWVSLEDVLRCC